MYLPKKVANANGGVSNLMIVHKVSTSLSLVDPNTLMGCDIANIKYWESPFEAVLTRKHLTEFVVLDLTQLQDNPHLADDVVANNAAIKQSGARKKLRLCEVEVARLSDLGRNDERVTVRCHLGHQLRVGDHVMGYDLRTANVDGMGEEQLMGRFENDGGAGRSGGGGANAKKQKGSKGRKAKADMQATGAQESVNIDFGAQDVILVRKKFVGGKNDLDEQRQWEARRQEKRKWQLRHLPVVDEEGNAKWKNGVKDARDLEQFKQDLEEDEELRREVLLYKKPARRGASGRGKGPPKKAEGGAEGGDDAMEGAGGEKEEGGGGAEGEDSDVEATCAESEEGEKDEDDDLPEIPLAEMLEGLKLGGEDEEKERDEDEESDISDL